MAMYILDRIRNTLSISWLKMEHNHSDYNRIVRAKTCPVCADIVVEYAINKLKDADLIFLYGMIDRDFASIEDQEKAETLLVKIQESRG